MHVLPVGARDTISFAFRIISGQPSENKSEGTFCDI